MGPILKGPRRGRRQGEQARHRLPRISLVQVTLDGKVITTRENPICSETAMKNAPVIISFPPQGIREGILMGVLRKNSVIAAITQCTSVTDRADLSLLTAAACGHQAALRVFGLLGDDIDHAVYCIAAPQRGSRPANHFDPLDVFDDRVLHIPIHSRGQWVEYRSAI